jgi:hypothetical protein
MSFLVKTVAFLANKIPDIPSLSEKKSVNIAYGVKTSTGPLKIGINSIPIIELEL